MSDPTPCNPAARRAYAILVREFFAGMWTTDQYEDRYFKIRQEHGMDCAVSDIFDAIWHVYDDIWPHRMRGRHRPTPQLRKLAARWVLFLRSDEPYAPPPVAPAKRTRNRILLFALAIFAVFLIVIGVTMSWYLSLVLFTLFLGAMYAYAWLAGGVSINREVAGAAFAPPPESIWPFNSPDSLRRVRATPTFLCGELATR